MCTLTLVALVIYWSLESLIPEPFGLISAFLPFILVVYGTLIGESFAMYAQVLLIAYCEYPVWYVWEIYITVSEN